MTHQYVNAATSTLKPYPMEALAKIRSGLQAKGKKVFDFGTGDPKIPLWPKINETLIASIPAISQYPSSKGSKDLIAAQQAYLENRFGIKPSPDIELLATRGSKEAIFHVALSVVGRAGGKGTIIYPDPGYPVYESSTIFAGGRPCPVRLDESNGFILEPWKLPEEVQKNAAAIWVNYPHNPTGATVGKAYWEQLIQWAHTQDCLVLSDDCYVDIYDSSIDAGDLRDRPLCPLELTSDRVICFFSLSKRSGLTGYRSGFMAGDSRFLKPHLEARANMGVGTPHFIESASALAWRDEAHVAARRKIFTQRIATAAPELRSLGLLGEAPKATFYLWCSIPKSYDDDVKFCLDLAETGVICSPSQWLSNGQVGYFRLALVPDDQDTAEAMAILRSFVKGPK
jgi:succinyldiaminopimelate transaminase